MQYLNLNQLFVLSPAQRENIVRDGYAIFNDDIVCAPARTAEEGWMAFFAWAQAEMEMTTAGGRLASLARVRSTFAQLMGDAEAKLLQRAYVSRWSSRVPLPTPDFESLREACRPKPKEIPAGLKRLGVQTQEELADFDRLRPYFKILPVKRIAEVIQAPALKRLPLWVKAQVAKNRKFDVRRPGRPGDLIAAATMWRLSNLFHPWKSEAARLGRLPLRKRLIAVAVASRMASEQGLDLSEGQLPQNWESNRQLRMEFWQRFNAACRVGLNAVLSDMPRDRTMRHRIAFLLHGKALPPVQVKALCRTAAPAQLAGLKAGAWVKAVEALCEGDPNWYDSYPRWEHEAALSLVACFGKRWQEWLNKQASLDRSGHDACYWLPKETPSRLKGLEHTLFRNGTRDIGEMEIVAKNWPGLLEEERQLPWREMLAVCRTRKYVGQRHEGFALEAAHWGVAASKYSAIEQIYLDAQSVPEPFDSAQRWEVGGYVGRFLPRSDVRVGFFGNYTNCCQHFEGLGNSCAVSSVADIFAQLFVVERDDEILAGSWVWQTQHGGFRSVCFDNVEAKGLSQRQHVVVADIYQEVAQSLCAEGCRKVTIGTNLSNLDLGRWETTEPLPLPKGYVAGDYTDSEEQVLVAENPSAPAIAQGQQMVWVRGALKADFKAAERIAAAVYPEGWDHVSYAGASSQGLMLMHEEAGVIGYATFDSQTRYIADLAVLPEQQHHSNVLLRALLERCSDGEWWSADCRASTSLRLLRLYARRGVITLEEQGQAGPIGEEPCTQVVFRVN